MNATRLITFGFGASAALVLTLGFGIRQLSTVARVCISDGAPGAVTLSDRAAGGVVVADNAHGKVELRDEVLGC